jgi:hypothetical protein
VGGSAASGGGDQLLFELRFDENHGLALQILVPDKDSYCPSCIILQVLSGTKIIFPEGALPKANAPQGGPDERRVYDVKQPVAAFRHSRNISYS